MIIIIIEYTKQVMHNAIAHHLLTNAQPVPEWQSSSPGPIPPVYMLNMMSYGMECPFRQFGSAVLAALPPGFLCIASLAGHGKLKSP